VKNERIVGTVLIALGALALFSWWGGSVWLWFALLAAPFLYYYAKQRNYAFLIVGAILAGLAAGLLLGGGGLILLGLGAAFFAIDRVEPRTSRWPLYPAAVLVALGLIARLGEVGLLGSVWFALLLIAAGVYLLFRGESWRYQRPAPRSAAEPPPVATPPPAEAPQASPESEVEENAAAGQEGLDAAREVAVADEDVYRRLESWRKRKAAEEGKPAYIILTNDSLAQLAREKPATIDDLRRIRGIGPVKLERYGEEILAVVKG
jgi:hypothetical protein